MKDVDQSLVGEVCGDLTVTLVRRHNKIMVVDALCSCGNNKTVNKNNFVKGSVSSCGCKATEARSKAQTKHGLSRTNTYNSWKKMMSRCYNTNDTDYKNYGGRGITVCDRWKDPINLAADMGERVKGMSIERKNVYGNYEPSNCVWLPLGEQPKNRTKWKHTPEGLKAIGDAHRLRKI